LFFLIAEDWVDIGLFGTEDENNELLPPALNIRSGLRGDGCCGLIGCFGK
jgi:hypothetical protein